jgi:hypothetical protein
MDSFKEGVRHMPALQLAADGRYSLVAWCLYLLLFSKLLVAEKENNGRQSHNDEH